MSDRERITEILKAYAKKNNISASSVILEEYAEELLANGVIAPLCKVGDPVWFLLEDDIPVHCWLLSEAKVTDVSAKGFYVSDCDPPEDDVEVFTPWTDVGIEAFFSKDAAEAAQKEREAGAV